MSIHHLEFQISVIKTNYFKLPKLAVSPTYLDFVKVRKSCDIIDSLSGDWWRKTFKWGKHPKKFEGIYAGSIKAYIPEPQSTAYSKIPSHR